MNIGREHHLSQKQKRIVSVIVLILFVLFVGLICFLIGRPMIEFVDEPEKFQAWVDKSGIWGRIIFLGMVIVQVILAIIPGEPIEIVAGYTFGAIEGSLLCIAGMAAGSMIVFAFVRTLGVRAVEVFFSIDKIRSLKFLQKSKRLNAITFLLMFIPGTPKDLISYFVGLTNMKWQTWFFISLFARIPSVITSTIGGSALGVRDYVDAIVVFAITLLISGIGILIYRIILKKRNDRIEGEKNSCKEIYSQFFNVETRFTEILFDEFFDNCENLKVKGEIVSILFKIPCDITLFGKKKNAYYLYGLATRKDFQGKGYMKQLLENSLNKSAIYFVKPLNDGLTAFYEKFGFKRATAFKDKECAIKIGVTPAHKELSLMRSDAPDEYTVMYRAADEIKEISFSYPLS